MSTATSTAAATSQTTTTSAYLSEKRHGRYGLDADSCRAGCEAMLIACFAVWVVAIIPMALGYLNGVLFLLNLPILLTGILSIVGLSPENPTALTLATFILCAISLACTIFYVGWTWTYVFLCIIYTSPCPPAPDTYISYTVGGVFGTFIFFFTSLTLLLLSSDCIRGTRHQLGRVCDGRAHTRRLSVCKLLSLVVPREHSS